MPAFKQHIVGVSCHQMTEDIPFFFGSFSIDNDNCIFLSHLPLDMMGLPVIESDKCLLDGPFLC